MKNVFLIILLFVFISSFGQNKGVGSWSVGAGISNSITHGDLRTGFKLDAVKNNIINLGSYAYIDKMFTPAFGFELKGRYTKMSGGAFELSKYPESFSGLTLNQLRFESTAFSVELNTILNLSSLRANPFSTKARKWNFATYAGIGWHQYDPILYNIATDLPLADVDTNSTSSDGHFNSIYFTAATSLKYKLSTNIDIELRQDFNVDEDDNIDGARSNKKDLDFFFNTSLGIVFKLNPPKNNNYIWIDEPIQIKDSIKEPKFILLDSDNDGVIDQFDKEPNTEKGAFVYGNGVTIDTDKDGVPDHKDKCPLRHAKTKEGCPKDIDGDGIEDDLDLCPNVAGAKTNMGCPDVTSSSDSSTTVISFEPIFFDINSFVIKKEFDQMLRKTVLVLAQNPDFMLVLEGHADVRGGNTYNQSLSEKRVNAVKETLISRGVEAERISTKGFGEINPSFNNIKFSLYNRRVDLILTK
ncbi:MAG TPA: OmpA family protein [Lutibacter sp.]|nr:OmpA family protein [Lutibacter sp.]